MDGSDAEEDVKASLTLEELLQLREKLNRKVYSELIFGDDQSGQAGESKRGRRKGGPSKRANHHRPREESSKKPPNPIIEVFPTKKVCIISHPRRRLIRIFNSPRVNL